MVTTVSSSKNLCISTKMLRFRNCFRSNHRRDGIIAQQKRLERFNDLREINLALGEDPFSIQDLLMESAERDELNRLEKNRYGDDVRNSYRQTCRNELFFDDQSCLKGFLNENEFREKY